MKPIIYCTQEHWGKDSFYIETNTGRYFLFLQDYRHDVHNYFRNGVALDKIYDFARCKRNRAIAKTQTKLPVYIRYAESEYGITVLDKTRRRRQRLQLAG